MIAEKSVQQHAQNAYDWLLCHASVSPTEELRLLPFAEPDAEDLISNLLCKLSHAMLTAPKRVSEVHGILQTIGISEEQLRMHASIVLPGQLPR